MLVNTNNFKQRNLTSIITGYDFQKGILFSGPICSECGIVCDPNKSNIYEDEAWIKENSNQYLCGKCIQKVLSDTDEYIYNYEKFLKEFLD